MVWDMHGHPPVDAAVILLLHGLFGRVLVHALWWVLDYGVGGAQGWWGGRNCVLASQCYRAKSVQGACCTAQLAAAFITTQLLVLLHRQTSGKPAHCFGTGCCHL